METAESVLDFWFEELGEKGWWKKDPALDATIRTRFADLRARALRGELDEWLATPRGALALVILLDQFSRNMYRDDPRMYEADSRALAVAREACERGHPAEVEPIQRSFFFMPMMHAEDLEAQKECVRHFGALAAGGGPDYSKYAKSHHDIVARFGRFPHRNEILGRASTDEERQFLKQPGSSF